MTEIHYYMGYEDTWEEYQRAEEAAMADDVYLERNTHIWPRLGDALTALPERFEIYALCGARLLDVQTNYQGAPIEFGSHWGSDATVGGGDVCMRCERLWGEQTEPPKPESQPGVIEHKMFVALHSGNPGASGLLNEVSGGGYARQPVTFGPMTSAGAASTNEQKFSMPVVTITHFTIKDENNVLLFSGQLTEYRQLRLGDVATFPKGAIRVNVSRQF